MRNIRFFWHTIVISSQYNPARFIELLMLVLAMILLLAWGVTEKWPYLALSLSYGIGSSISILIRESMMPSHRTQLTQLMAILLLILSVYGFADLLHYL